ncbi:P-loop containing nucleoside triphosphate hydrolase protein, partial [Teratosphaeria destructans]
LVVVGDQSSGKSSLLESLTGLNFPVASELCTRFATQIVLRRSLAGQGSVHVSIIPGPSAKTDEQRLRLQSFSRTIDADSLSKDEFASILDEVGLHIAAVTMGLPAASDHHYEDLHKRFSDDILKIELVGPEHHHLSVVDVPGLFHNPTKFQTLEDLDIIRVLLEGYISDKRTIILAVMDARNNLANQEVFRMARAADPQGKRTVGIITKCDAVQAGDEDMVLKIAQNTVERLTHGWFAVKNRSTQDIQNGVTLQQRHQNERRFFQASPWNALSKDRVGVSALKQFLGKLLYDHIRGEFPTLVQDIRDLAMECDQEIAQLGAPRQTTLQQRQYLMELAAHYRHNSDACLRGNYGDQWGPGDPRKLRMHLQLANEDFASKMAREGHCLAFRNVDDTVDEEYGQGQEKENIYTWIRQQYRESRGAELPGTVNPTVLESLFRRQAGPWKQIAQDHLNAIYAMVSSYNARSLQELVIDDTVRQRIENRNFRPMLEAKDQGNNQLYLLLADEMSGILQTTNHYFAESLTAYRQDRVLQRLKKLGFENDNEFYQTTLADITRATHLSNEEQAVCDIHDILKSYYRVAIKRFVDNVVLQAVERCYLSNEGPVKFISPKYIGGLSDEDLSDIAQESYATSRTRADLSYRLARLEKALAIAEAEQAR